MSDKLDPLLVPAIVDTLLRRIAQDVGAPSQPEGGTKLVVTKSISGTHEWDRGMASGLATVTLQPGDIVECLGGGLISGMHVLPVTDDIDAFVAARVNSSDQPYVERHRLVIRIREPNASEHFSRRDEHDR